MRSWSPALRGSEAVYNYNNVHPFNLGKMYFTAIRLLGEYIHECPKVVISKPIISYKLSMKTALFNQVGLGTGAMIQYVTVCNTSK